MHNHATRNNSFILRNVTRLHVLRRCLRKHVSVVLSNTCDNIINKINKHSCEGFAAYVKKYIISSYSTECSNKNCYVCGAWLLNMQSENCYVLCLQMSFPSSIRCDGYLITSTYCIEVLPLIVYRYCRCVRCVPVCLLCDRPCLVKSTKMCRFSYNASFSLCHVKWSFMFIFMHSYVLMNPIKLHY